MGAFNLLFTTNGRLSRSQFWLGHLVLSLGWIPVIVTFVVSVGDQLLRGNARVLEGLSAQPPSIILLIVLLSYMSFCVSAKRLHDLDKSAAWMLVFQGPAMLLWLGPTALNLPIVGLLHIAVWIGGLWFFVELGLFPGTPGPNRFGGDDAPVSPEGGGSSWADAITFDDRRPANPAAPRIPTVAVNLASTPQQAARSAVRSAAVRGPVRAPGFGRRGLSTT